MMTISAHRAGSSPHARGLRARTQHRELLPGIIPACAGFTFHSHFLNQLVEGSSPHARGLPDGGHGVGQADRIIPACAGFTPGRSRCCSRWGDHPRMRGVYHFFSPFWRMTAGSSPHARGLRRILINSYVKRRIIPARAGFTRRALVSKPKRRDHPRTRGVYVARSPPTIVGGGSSPHARGLPEAREGPSPPARIIPARAGFTTPHPRRIRRGGDHPRTRGVYPDDSSVAQRHAGSSPHARGLQAPAGPARRVHRIIPARAGFTGVR